MTSICGEAPRLGPASAEFVVLVVVLSAGAQVVKWCCGEAPHSELALAEFAVLRAGVREVRSVGDSPRPVESRLRCSGARPVASMGRRLAPAGRFPGLRSPDVLA